MINSAPSPLSWDELYPDFVTRYAGLGHWPVLLREVLKYSDITHGETVVDATFGRGGYTRGFLSLGANVTAFDRDPEAEKVACELQTSFPSLTFIKDTFSRISDHIAPHSVDVLVADLGISSPQVDTPERGFSFQNDGLLDMRMSASGTSAADIVNTWGEKELADMFYTYGDETKSRRIASQIVAVRKETPFTSTLQLASFIEKIKGRHPKDKKHPATQVFQALRIAVNNELEELETLLNMSLTLLKPQGRLVIVSFHSLEDRLVKQFMKTHSETQETSSRYMPVSPDKIFQPVLKRLHSKGITAKEDELSFNNRSRSAVLRASVFTPSSS